MFVGLFSCFGSRIFLGFYDFFNFWSFFGFPWNTLYTSSAEARNSVTSSSKLWDIRPSLFLCHIRAALLRHYRDVYPRTSDGLSRGRQPSLLKSLMALFLLCSISSGTLLAHNMWHSTTCACVWWWLLYGSNSELQF